MKNFLPILFSVLILTFLTGLGIITIIHFVVDNKVDNKEIVASSSPSDDKINSFLERTQLFETVVCVTVKDLQVLDTESEGHYQVRINDERFHVAGTSTICYKT